MTTFAGFIDRLGQDSAGYVATFKSGASAAEFHELEAFLEITVPDALRALWLEHNGNVGGASGAKPMCFDGRHVLLSLAEASTVYKDLHESDEGTDAPPKGFLPVGQAPTSELLLVNCRKSSATYGAVYAWEAPNLARVSKSLDGYFKTMGAWVEGGALTVQGASGAVLQDAKSKQIGKPLNSGCDFFDKELPSAGETKDWE